MEYTVTDEELRRIPGCTPLKIYIVLNNSPNGATATMLADATGSPRRSVFSALQKMQKSSLLCKNGTIYCRFLHKSATFGKEREKNQKRRENSLNGEKYSSSTSYKQVFDVLFSWLTSDEVYLVDLCELAELVPASSPDNELRKELLRPFVQVFARWLRVQKSDILKKGAEDCKNHFLRWLPSQIERRNKKAAAKAKSSSSPRSARGQQLTEEQQAEQMLQKRRRMEKAEEQQRHLDEIQRAADGSTDTTARDRIFARLGLNKTKGSG